MNPYEQMFIRVLSFFAVFLQDFVDFVERRTGGMAVNDHQNHKFQQLFHPVHQRASSFAFHSSSTAFLFPPIRRSSHRDTGNTARGAKRAVTGNTSSAAPKSAVKRQKRRPF